MNTSSATASENSLLIRRSRAEDKPALHELVAATGVFSSEEVTCARELIDESLAKIGSPGADEGYQLLIAELPEDGRIVGYVCYGHTPFTAATWDLYWLATHPDVQRRGVARTIVAAMEQAIRDRGGQNVRVETSGTAGYAAARGFYERNGYTLMARLTDFYKPGDDLFSFFKRL